MGGFLQTILFGLPGLRLWSDRLALNPQLVEGMEQVKARGLHYRGATMTLEYDEDHRDPWCDGQGAVSGWHCPPKAGRGWPQPVTPSWKVRHNCVSIQYVALRYGCYD